MASFYVYVTGEQPLKLAHSLLGYAVGMTVNNGLDGQSLGSRHKEINFNQIYFPKKQLKNTLSFFNNLFLTRFKIKLQK